MPLIKRKIELKPKQTKGGVLAAASLSHELSLSTRQKAKIGNVFSNIMSFDT